MREPRLTLVLLMVSVVAVACGQPPIPQDRFYRLEAPSPETVVDPPRLEGTLEVVRMAADGLTAGRPIVYSDAGNPLEAAEYAYHFWTQPPTIMLRDELVKYLRAAGVARAVVTPELRLEPDYVLTGRIKRLERVLGGTPKALIEMELALRQRRDERLIVLRTYRSEHAVPEDSVAATVTAMNTALAEIYANFLEDLLAAGS